MEAGCSRRQLFQVQRTLFFHQQTGKRGDFFLVAVFTVDGVGGFVFTVDGVSPPLTFACPSFSFVQNISITVEIVDKFFAIFVQRTLLRFRRRLGTRMNSVFVKTVQLLWRAVLANCRPLRRVGKSRHRTL